MDKYEIYVQKFSIILDEMNEDDLKSMIEDRMNALDKKHFVEDYEDQFGPVEI